MKKDFHACAVIVTIWSIVVLGSQFSHIIYITVIGVS